MKELTLSEQLERATVARDHCLTGGTGRQAHQHGDDFMWLMGYADNYYEVELIKDKIYREFLESKSQSDDFGGFEPLEIPAFLFDFQASLTDWALRKGKAAIFADCGLGKTAIELVWADNIIRKTNGRVLLLTPLAVGAQTVAEGQKFGIECGRSRDGSFPKEKLIVANYEKLHLFNPSDFAGMVCDESSILKSFDGSTKAAVTEFMRRMEYRLLCTATASPNDYIELGTSSEALGELGYMDMLARFFKNDQGSINPMSVRHGGESGKWRFRHHAETPFWKWVCSWARAIRKPSDLGFDDARFVLPKLTELEHDVKAPKLRDGLLFDIPAVGLKEQREERRVTLKPRCERAAGLIDGKESSIAWCHLNSEGDLLEKMIPGAVQIAGSDSDEAKEERLLAFISGQARVLVTKPVCAGFGLNFQHCSHMTTFPSHSFEQYYQSVRRCWRFGQSKPVQVDVISTEGERSVLANLQRKAAAADVMFANLVSYMNESIRVEKSIQYPEEVQLPSWA